MIINNLIFGKKKKSFFINKYILYYYMSNKITANQLIIGAKYKEKIGRTIEEFIFISYCRIDSKKYCLFYNLTNKKYILFKLDDYINNILESFKINNSPIQKNNKYKEEIKKDYIVELTSDFTPILKRQNEVKNINPYIKIRFYNNFLNISKNTDNNTNNNIEKLMTIEKLLKIKEQLKVENEFDRELKRLVNLENSGNIDNYEHEKDKQKLQDLRNKYTPYLNPNKKKKPTFPITKPTRTKKLNFNNGLYFEDSNHTNNFFQKKYNTRLEKKKDASENNEIRRILKSSAVPVIVANSRLRNIKGKNN
jgi:hypothetical protein